MRLIMISIVLAFCGSLLTAGTIDPKVQDKQYIQYGESFKYVGKLCGTYSDNTKFCGSAVAIDDHHILTAAHVVKGSTSCYVYIEGKEFCLQEMTIHKDFNDKQFGVADIAIGYSEKSFGLDFYPSLYDEDEEIGKVCCIAGYGFHGTFLTGAKFYDDKRRAGSNVIDSIEKDLLICSPSKHGDKTLTELEFLIASGDSGGGLFVGERLAGINSCIMSLDKSPSAKYNEESGHTRVSKFISWIKQHKTK